ncbi:glycosyltransferase [Krasilnikoviella flava]|uniref:D-inositol 3-phosphate glycosyltransferase n=1 Tax=Krasilnikoviella flava TaxID=526729 RepID=A0A1T5IEW5_9MICO|nr:glycosyltransferase [Krasilnikoviella flava]SKC37563.1 Glycosyltransferase involved in cell wall bisynthesis [Krasilnikoviella flava]
MRVLRISHSAVVDAWRGREVELRRHGDHVRVLTAAVWDEGGRDVRPSPAPDEELETARTLGRHPALFLYDPRALWRVLGEPWDVLDIHEEPVALATAEILGLRAVRRFVDAARGRRARPAPYLLYSAQNLLKRYPWPFRALEAAALRGAAAVVTCNHDAARIVRYKGARGLVQRIPLGLDTTRFTPSTARADDPAPGRVRVGYAGRLTTQKGVDVLLAAVARDESLGLVVAGAGPEEVRLRRAAAPLGDRVTFLGPLDTDDLPAFYRGLDVLVVPSVETPGLAEQFGRVVVEAMACGTPVVATRVGSVPDVVAGAGVLVAPGDPAALLDGIRQATRPQTARVLRLAGLDRARECSWPEVAGRYRAVYAACRGTTTDDHGVTARGGADHRPAPRIEVVVVAYGRPELLRAALEPLAGTFPLTVVDNSSDPRHRAITEACGGVYHDPGRNLGFAAAVNMALAHRQDPGADVFLLNPDAVVGPDAVAALHDALHADPGLASVGPAQVDGDGRPGRVVWPFPSPARAWLEAAGLGRFRIPGERSFVIGSALLVRAEALRSVGALDERFFLYAEETDWAYRADRRGWRHAVVETTKVLHEGAGTSTDDRVRELHFHASQERYLRKHYGAAGWAAARAALVAGAALRSAALRGPGRRHAQRRLRTYLGGPTALEGREVAAS